MALTTNNRFRGCLLGLAVGDAVGTTLEFTSRGSFKPLTDMVGGGPFGLKPGEWTDDTSMALCLGVSLVSKNGFDPDDQMQRYCRWYRDGYLSSNGVCFDIGNTISSALREYEATGNPYSGQTSPQSAGNGSLMRLAPIALYYYPDTEAAEHFAAESSRTTHGAQECIDACRLFARILCRALAARPKQEVLLADSEDFFGGERIESIAQGGYRDQPASAISGSGYVVRCLEAALWAFERTDTFEAAILMAANLGDDADTTAAVCGQVAGAFYGESGIPQRWLKLLAFRHEIAQLSDELHAKPDRSGLPPDFL